MSIINTVKQFEPEKESRAGSTYVIPTTTPLTTEQVSIVQQSKKKKKSKNKIPDESPEQSVCPRVDQEDIKVKLERIFEHIHQNEEKKAKMLNEKNVCSLK